MKTLNIQELRSIEQFFQLRQPSLMKAMRQYLKTKYTEVIYSKDYLIAVGDIPIALVAHTDTVFKNPPQRIFYDKEKNVMWSPEGLGADDRAGVYSIVQIIKAGLRPTIIFVADEELGCIGATALIKAYPKAPTDLKYIIELDRRGSNDCVFYNCDNEYFEEYVEDFGFSLNFGSFSDISTICPAWGIAGVNLSIGYYDEHSYSETLYVGQMLSTIDRVKRMLYDAKNAEHFEYHELYRLPHFSKFETIEEFEWDPSFGVSKEEWESFMNPQSKCHDCGQWDFDYNLFPTKAANNETKYFCCDCISKRPDIRWCKTCGEPFMDAEQPKGKAAYCQDCRGKK